MSIRRRILLSLLVVGIVANVIFVGGTVCYKFGVLSEGIIIFGAILGLILMGAGVFLINRIYSQEADAADAGEILTTTECRCRINGDSAFFCLLVVGDDGLVIDGQDEGFGTVQYDEIIDLQHTKFELQMKTVDEDYHFLCQSPIKIKAMYQLITQRME